MIDLLSNYRSGIERALSQVIRGSEHLSRVNSWGPDLIERLYQFAASGKLIRGSLVCASAQAFGSEPGPAAYRVGAVMELIQSFLLIHDDIMDQDAIRRGAPAVYEQYRLQGHTDEYSNTARYGESMGICAGDVAVLLAFEAISTLELPPSLVVAVSRFVAAEIADVGVAQMADVAHGHQPSEPSEQQILDVYRMKTGRYTFSVPLVLGAMLAGADQSAISAVSEWGEIQGVIFQLRDDELGLMGETNEIGKPAGTDVSSDKKTLHRALLLARCGESGCDEVRRLFGTDEIGEAGMQKVRQALRDTGTLTELARRVEALGTKAQPLLDSMTGLTDEGRDAFARLAEYNASRET